MSDLQIFELGIKLAQLLNGDKEAIADIKKLYERHPEMFKNIDDVAEVIKEVVKEPNLVIDNPKAVRDKDFMAYKKLNDKKMGDVGIHNDGGTNIIFHANKTTMSNKDKQMLVEASSAKAAPTRLDHYADKPNDLSRCNKALSTSVNENSTTKEIQSQANSKQAKIKALKDEVKKISEKNIQTKDKDIER